MNPSARIFLVGPTAVGKTALSLSLAQYFGFEIISMDSMQIYRGMDIGTAKATPAERACVPHHLIDFQSPAERFTVRDYWERAQQVLTDLQERGKRPLFVGGTGLYLSALLENWQFGNFDADEALRERLRARYDAGGAEALYVHLQTVDPKTAARLTPSDRKKIIRALEVYEKTGRPLSAHHAAERPEKQPPSLVLVLSDDRPELYARIDARVLTMWKQGLLEENLALLRAGISPKSQAMQAIGYKEVQWYLRGLLNESELCRLLQQHSRNYAKRQLTWFRKVPGAQWILRHGRSDMEIFEEARARISGFLAEGVRRN